MSSGDPNPQSEDVKIINPILALFIPRLQDMLFITIFLGSCLIGPRIINGDLGRHLTLGKYMVTSLNIPVLDMFSFTKSGQPRPPYEWLAQVVYYLAYRILNLDGVVWLSSFVLAITFLLLFLDARHRSGLPVIALLLVLWAAAASSIDWLARPQIFSFLLFTIWIRWLEKLRSGERIPIWYFPLLMLIWSNLHGGFIFGILVWVAYLTGWAWDSLRRSANKIVGKKLIIVGVTSLLASIITPDFWRNWQAVLGNNSIYILSHTSETRPPDFAMLAILPYVGLLLFSLIFLILGRKHIPASQIILVVGFAALSALMARNIPFFAIATAPVMAGYLKQSAGGLTSWINLENWLEKMEGSLKGYGSSIFILLITIGFFSYYQLKARSSLNQFNSQTFPVNAANWMESNSVKGNVFNDFNWGGYLLYRIWPSQRLFIDSQSDFYGESLTRQYAEIIDGNGNWGEVLNQYNVLWIVIPRKAGLVNKVLASNNWGIAYEDPLTIIFARK